MLFDFVLVLREKVTDKVADEVVDDIPQRPKAGREPGRAVQLEEGASRPAVRAEAELLAEILGEEDKAQSHHENKPFGGWIPRPLRRISDLGSGAFRLETFICTTWPG